MGLFEGRYDSRKVSRQPAISELVGKCLDQRSPLLLCEAFLSFARLRHSDSVVVGQRLQSFQLVMWPSDRPYRSSFLLLRGCLCLLPKPADNDVKEGVNCGEVASYVL